MSFLIGASLALGVGVFLIVNPGVPVWYRGFCLAYDLVAAGYLAALLIRSRAAR